MFVRAEGSTVIKYPYTKREARFEYPNVSFPDAWNADTLAEFGIYKVRLTEKPAGDVVTQVDPVFDGNEWVQTWSVRNYTLQEKAIADNKIADESVRRFVNRNSQIKALLLAEPAQIETYINNNVTNLQSAKEVLIILAQTVSALSRGLMRDEF